MTVISTLKIEKRTLARFGKFKAHYRAMLDTNVTNDDFLMHLLGLYAWNEELADREGAGQK